MEPARKILLVDDHAVVIAGTRMILQNAIPGLEFDEAGNGRLAQEKTEMNKYDLVILDVNMPEFHAFSFITRLKEINKEQRILVFSMNPEETFALRFLRLGVNGYLSKESPAEKLVDAVQKILDGKNYFSEEFLYSMLVENKPAGSVKELSTREFEVMHHLVKGLGISAIGKLMNLAPSTVATHKNRIFEKLGVKNVIELSQYTNIIPTGDSH